MTLNSLPLLPVYCIAHRTRSPTGGVTGKSRALLHVGLVTALIGEYACPRSHTARERSHMYTGESRALLHQHPYAMHTCDPVAPQHSCLYTYTNQYHALHFTPCTCARTQEVKAKPAAAPAPAATADTNKKPKVEAKPAKKAAPKRKKAKEESEEEEEEEVKPAKGKKAKKAAK